MDIEKLRKNFNKANRDYRNARELSERVCILDLETTGFKGDFNGILSYGIADLRDKKKIIVRGIDYKDWYKGLFDLNLVRQAVKEIEPYDRIIVHYGGDYRFDIPFLRTRAVRWITHGFSIAFPLYGEKKYIDTWKILKQKFCLSSNRLGRACDTFNIKSKEHSLNPEVWSKIYTGNIKFWGPSMEYIKKHNREDVISTRDLAIIILPYINWGNQNF